ncbi:helix-turn-helix domain-containing protein, partial [Rhizobium johnstonii]|uniref:helix-turn-helix domain-containing protein n=1 Tax=Rhizobium johnstonii TaxID=3019933 RepID=UPI003F94FAD4
MKEWITVAEAATLVGRHISRVYRWIEQGQLATSTNEHGVTVVLSKAALRIESVTKRGRPKGTASR